MNTNDPQSRVDSRQSTVRSPQSTISRAWTVAWALALGAALVVGLVWRVTKIPNEIHAQSTQLMGAIALTYLPITFSDFGAHVLDNFWKFLFHGEHSLDDYAFCYTVIRTLDTLGLPIIPRYIYLAQTMLNTVCVIVVYALARRMFSPAVAVVSALFLWLSWEFISYTRVLYNFSLPVTVTVLVLYVAHLHYTTRTWISTVLFALILMYALGTQFIFLSPVLGFLYVVLRAGASNHLRQGYGGPPKLRAKAEEAPYTRGIDRLQWIVIAAPALAMVAFQVYLYTRIGESGLGMFARVGKAYDPTQLDASRLADAGSNAWSLLHLVFKRPWLTVGFSALVVVQAARLIACAVSRRGPVLTFSTFVLFWLLFALAAGAYALNQSYVIIAPMAILVGLYCVKWAHLMRRRPVVVGATLVPILGAHVYASAAGYRDYPLLPEMPYKAVGYFVRTEGRPFARVFNVQGDLAETLQCQYYYGKNYQVYDKPERPSRYFAYRSEIKKLIFSSQELPLESLDRAARVGRIDFYVFYEDTEESSPGDVEIVRRNGFVPVARILDGGKMRAVIYGRPELGYRDLDMLTTNQRWEQEIARLPRLYEHHRIGVADFWGHWEIGADEVE